MLESAASVSAPTADPQSVDNALTLGTVVAVEALLDLSLVATPPIAVPGQTVVLTATTRNDGPSDAAGLSISVPLPPGLERVGVDADAGAVCSGSDTVVCRWAGATPPGTARSVRITVRFTAAPGSTVQIEATAASESSAASADATLAIASLAATAVPVDDPRALLPMLLALLLIGGARLRRARRS